MQSMFVDTIKSEQGENVSRGVRRSAKRCFLGGVNTSITDRGIQKAGFTQPI